MMLSNYCRYGLIVFILIIITPHYGLCYEGSLIIHPVGNHNFIPITLEDNIENIWQPSTSNKKGISEHISPVLNVTLLVKVNKHNVKAIIRFKNKSSETLYVHRRKLPIRPARDDPYFSSPLCEDAFSITTKGVRLRFLPVATNICDFIEDNEDDTLYLYENSYDIHSDWMNIPPEKTKTLMLNLNDAYSFISGSHLYEINSLQYRVANEKWFLQRATNKLLFFIINFQYQTCSEMVTQNLTIECNTFPLVEHKEFSDMILTFFPEGGKNHHYSDIKSNAIRININGDDVISYDQTKIELLKKRYGIRWEETR